MFSKKWAARYSASAVLFVLSGCGDGTDVKLAKVPPVAPAPEQPKPADPPRKVKGPSGSPAVLPGSSQ